MGVGCETNGQGVGPDLLEALKKVREAIIVDDFGNYTLYSNFDTKKIDSAIAKADGRHDP